MSGSPWAVGPAGHLGRELGAGTLGHPVHSGRVPWAMGAEGAKVEGEGIGCVVKGARGDSERAGPQGRGGEPGAAFREGWQGHLPRRCAWEGVGE